VRRKDLNLPFRSIFRALFHEVIIRKDKSKFTIRCLIPFPDEKYLYKKGSGINFLYAETHKY